MSKQQSKSTRANNDRANVKNPNNPAHKAAQDNRSRQLNAQEQRQESPPTTEKES